MFSYLTGAAKKAVSRRGKEPHKFRSASRPLPRRPAPRPSVEEKSKQRRPDLAHAAHPPTHPSPPDTRRSLVSPPAAGST